MATKKMPLPPGGAASVITAPAVDPLDNKQQPFSDRGGIDKVVAEQRTKATLRARELRSRLSNTDPKEILEGLASSTAEMYATTQEVSAAGAELQQTITEIMAAAKQAASATAQSSAGIKQIQRASGVFSDVSQSSLEKIRLLQDLVRDTVEGMQELITGIKLAVDVNRTSGAAVNKVESQSGDIRGVVQEVVKVAEQINLFAFNAALEASRAGKHGVGFSIVADEVRLLAQRTTSSANMIEEVLDEIIRSVGQVVKDMEVSINDSERWSGEANDVIGKMNEATVSMDLVNEASSAINEMIVDLTDVLEKTEENSTVIQNSTEHSSRASNEANNALIEQSNALRGIQSASKELTNMAENLKASSLNDENAEEIGTIADELSATIQEAASAANQINSSFLVISRESEILAGQAKANVPYIDRAKEQISEIKKRGASSFEQVKGLGTTLKNTTKAIDSIIENTNIAADKNIQYSLNIKKLQSDVLRIDEIIDALLAIGIMTNLLSVSGRIEGARSGDAGAGFINVSEDIRRLAETTSNSVTNIRRLVRNIQLSVSVVVSDLEKVGMTIRGEAEKAKKTTSQVRAVDKDVAEILQANEKFLVAAEEAGAGVPQVTQGMQMITDSASQAATATTQAFVASQEQTQAMQELASTVDDLAVQISFLRK